MASNTADNNRRNKAMSTMTWGMVSDFYLGDMRVKNRTQDSINTNAGHLRRFVEWLGGPERMSRLRPGLAASPFSSRWR